MDKSLGSRNTPFARSLRADVGHPLHVREAHSPGEPASARRHLLTIALEDYYQVGAFRRLIQESQWYCFETRVECGTLKTLELLDEFDIRATFFVLGWIADRLPELVRHVAERGHEIASRGYYHRSIRQLTPPEFREDLTRSREALERATGRRVVGYRIGHGWFGPSDLWALDVLAEHGYEYDSSIGPILRSYASARWRRFAHTHSWGNKTIWEFPISTANVFGLHVPIAGGNYFRQLPHGLVKRAVARWDQTCPAPFVMYFHTWELDPDQPKISAAPLHARIRQYRHLDAMPGILRHYFERYRFTAIADHLELSTAPMAADGNGHGTVRPAITLRRVSTPGEQATRRNGRKPEGRTRTPVSVVVPCYNEELTLPYLANTLKSVEDTLAEMYAVHFIFVDDRSTDGTWDALQRLFGAKSNCTLVRHDCNRGVAAGILTGIQSARTEIVCSIDCDCTYDPHELEHMIPLLTEDVDLVTASPYHPGGGVRNVPWWRLVLSRSASFLYGVVLRQKLRTYTSCFRVYRRRAALGVQVEHAGFLGIVEMLGKLDLAGAKIVEYPTTLEQRMLGVSKMKIVRTVFHHVGLLSYLAFRRIADGIRPRSVARVTLAPGAPVDSSDV